MRISNRFMLPISALTIGTLAATSACSSGDSSDTSGSSSAASSATSSAAKLTLSDGWAKAAKSGMSAAFGTLKNDSTSPITLTKVSSSLGDTQLHVMKKTANGPVMTEADKFVIPAHGSLTLKPGSNHIMFMGVKQKLVVGDTVKVTLEGTNGFRQDVSFPVRAFDGAKENYQPKSSTKGAEPSGHSSMDHSTMNHSDGHHSDGHHTGGNHTSAGHEGMDHSTMDHSGMDHSSHASH